jgi:leader peptidase (prepilin peptidase)/N-methyltransferase
LLNLRILGTIFAALAGLAFGSFLNVCLTRWPEGESILKPRSHCRNCDRTLAWWENIPLLSWIALRGRCRTCGAWIGIRYPLVELAMGVGWAIVASRPFPDIPWDTARSLLLYILASRVLSMTLVWLLVALAALDTENLWLPDFLTIPGIVIGFGCAALDPFVLVWLDRTTGLPLTEGFEGQRFGLITPALAGLAAILLAALLILLIRWTYKLLRKREGIGLGDAKLMAMLGAWLGLPGALLSFFIGVVLGALVALIVLALPSTRARETSAGEDAEATPSWSLRKLPLGTFLCIGGIISALWGQPILAAYLRWAGF